MSAATLALVVWLGTGASLPAPDLQVEAVSAAGSALSELTDALARALVVSGAHVVLRTPTSGPCSYCAEVTVVEAGAGSFRIEIVQAGHLAKSTLHFPAGSSLVDRARALALQTRLLLTWKTSADMPTSQVATEERSRRGVRRRPSRAATAATEPASAAEASSKSVAAAFPIPAEASVPAADPVAPPAPKVAPSPEPSVKARDSEPMVAAKPADSEPAESPRAASRKSSPSLDAAKPAAATARSASPLAEQSDPRRWWPWIPTAIGAGAAIAAGACALVARERYNALSDRSQSYSQALATKQSGENWQRVGFALAGVAAVGIGTGLVGFWMRPALTPQASVWHDGGMIAIAGALP